MLRPYAEALLLWLGKFFDKLLLPLRTYAVLSNVGYAGDGGDFLLPKTGNNTNSSGCCLSGLSPYVIPDHKGTFCCSYSGYTPYAYRMSKNYDSNGTSLRGDWRTSCCDTHTSIIASLGNNWGELCCYSNQKAYYRKYDISYYENNILSKENISTVCCSAQYAVSLPDDQGHFCCASDAGYGYGGAYYLANHRRQSGYAPTWSTKCCASQQTAVSMHNPENGTYCCSTGQIPYLSFYNFDAGWNQVTYSPSCCTGSIFSSLLIDDLSTEFCCNLGETSYGYYTETYKPDGSLAVFVPQIGCCSSPVSLPNSWGTYCCSSNLEPYATSTSQLVYQGGLSTRSGPMQIGCCSSGKKATSLPHNLGTTCCSSGIDTYAYSNYISSLKSSYELQLNWVYGCCLAGTQRFSLPNNWGTYCCSGGKGYANRYNWQSALAEGYSSQSLNVGCCLAGTSPTPYYFTSFGTSCCSGDVYLYESDQTYYDYEKRTDINYKTSCCTAGTFAKTLHNNLGTYCCSTNNAYIYEAILDYSSITVQTERRVRSVGCCTAGTTLRTLDNNIGTYCCPTNEDVYMLEEITGFHSDGTPMRYSRIPGCCSSLQPLPNNWGDYCCTGNLKAYGYISKATYASNGLALNLINRQIGCCPTGTEPKSLVSGLGTACCSAGKNPVVTYSSSSFIQNFASYSNRYDRYTLVTCQ